jgi:hypothetical protein
MRRDMTASSRHEHLVLYDPAAIPLDTPVDPDLEAQEPRPLPSAAMEDLARQGLALVLRIACEDCHADFRLIVDETPEPFFRERAVEALDGVTLHVPSGALVIDGVEFLCRAGETRFHSEAQSIEIPAGDYDVQVLNLMPWKSRHRALKVEKRTTRVDRIVGGIVGAFGWLGFVLLFASFFIGAPAILLVLVISGWYPALVLAGVVLVVDLLALAGFWALDLASRWFPALRRASEIGAAFDVENPDVVVCLDRVAGNGTAKVVAMVTLDFE